MLCISTTIGLLIPYSRASLFGVDKPRCHESLNLASSINQPYRVIATSVGLSWESNSLFKYTTFDTKSCSLAPSKETRRDLRLNIRESLE